MPQVDNNDIPLNRSGHRQRSSSANVSPEARLNDIVADITGTGNGPGHSIDGPRQSSSIVKYVMIFLFVIFVAAYTVVQLSSREAGTVRSNENVVASTQQDLVQPHPENEEGIDVGNVAPDFTLTNLYGANMTLSDYRGTVVILDFWASWCPPCNAAIPKLVTLQERYGDKDFIILAVAVDAGMDVSDKLSQFVDEHKINYHVLLNNENVTKAYKVKSVPTTFIIDKQGHIVNKYIGLDENSYENTIPAQIESLLQK